jgi:hypothetical protein
MSNTPASSDDGFEVVVGSDGALTVPAAELARLGVRPGAHLRLVVDASAQGDKPRPGRSAGKLAHLIPASAIEAWARALDEDRAERRATYGHAAG